MTKKAEKLPEPVPAVFYVLQKDLSRFQAKADASKEHIQTVLDAVKDLAICPINSIGEIENIIRNPERVIRENLLSQNEALLALNMDYESTLKMVSLPASFANFLYQCNLWPRVKDSNVGLEFFAIENNVLTYSANYYKWVESFKFKAVTPEELKRLELANTIIGLIETATADWKESKKQNLKLSDFLWSENGKFYPSKNFVIQ